MNPHGFAFAGMLGMPNPASFFANAGGFQSFSSSGLDGQSVVINEHNQSVRIRDDR